MENTNAVAVALVAADGVIDKLELETSIPKSDRTYLGAYQTKLAAGLTRKDEDARVIEIFRVWAIHRHKQ